MRTFIRSTLLLTGLILSGLSAHAAETGRSVVTVKDADYFGFDLRTVQNVTLDQCQTTCIGDEQCKAFTYNVKAKWCFLKSDFNKMNPFPGAVAGKVVVAQTEPDMGAAPSLAFLTEQQVNDAKRFRDDMTTADGQSNMGMDSLLFVARKDVTSGMIDHALLTFKSALVITPDDSQLWTEMADAANRITGNWDVNNQGLSAAINAYLSSRTRSLRAQALASMAKALENTQNYRAGINAYKASLKLVESPAVQTAYEDLRSRQGFRVTGNTIDNDSATPRACVQFSEALVKNEIGRAHV